MEEGVVMVERREVTYRQGTRDEITRFFLTVQKKLDFAYPAALDETRLSRCNEFLVAKVGGMIVGATAIIVPCKGGERSLFDVVAVDPDHRRQGIGTELTERTLRRLVESKYLPILCDIAEPDMRPRLRRSPYAAHIRVINEGFMPDEVALLS
jgi:ribosomal protein S18 acetylase RimI-like enzyme